MFKPTHFLCLTLVINNPSLLGITQRVTLNMAILLQWRTAEYNNPVLERLILISNSYSGRGYTSKNTSPKFFHDLLGLAKILVVFGPFATIFF